MKCIIPSLSASASATPHGAPHTRQKCACAVKRLSFIQKHAHPHSERPPLHVQVREPLSHFSAGFAELNLFKSRREANTKGSGLPHGVSMGSDGGAQRKSLVRAPRMSERRPHLNGLAFVGPPAAVYHRCTQNGRQRSVNAPQTSAPGARGGSDGAQSSPHVVPDCGCTQGHFLHLTRILHRRTLSKLHGFFLEFR